jgi:transposase
VRNRILGEDVDLRVVVFRIENVGVDTQPVIEEFRLDAAFIGGVRFRLVKIFRSTRTEAARFIGIRNNKRAPEVLSGPERRRRWSSEEKLRVLAQSIAPGSSASLTCRLHGISSGQLYTWRKQFRLGELTGFVPVSIAPEPPRLPGPELATQSSEPTTTGVIEVVLPTAVNLRVSGAVMIGAPSNDGYEEGIRLPGRSSSNGVAV